MAAWVSSGFLSVALPPLPSAPPTTHTATSVDPKVPRSSSGVPQCLTGYLGVSQEPQCFPPIFPGLPYSLPKYLVSPDCLSLVSYCFSVPPSLLFGIPPQLPWGLTSEVLVSHLPPHPLHHLPFSCLSVPHTGIATISPRSSSVSLTRLPLCHYGCLSGPQHAFRGPQQPQAASEALDCLGSGQAVTDLLLILAASMFSHLPQLCHPSDLHVPTLPIDPPHAWVSSMSSPPAHFHSVQQAYSVSTHIALLYPQLPQYTTRNCLSPSDCLGDPLPPGGLTPLCCLSVPSYFFVFP